MERSKYVVSVTDYNTNQSGKQLVEIRANSIEDVPGLQEEWDTGSILCDITAKKIYMLDKSGQWVQWADYGDN